MPLIHIQTSAPTPDDPAPLLQELSGTLATLLGKPERYVMTLLNAGMVMSFAGDVSPCAYVEVKSIGALEKEQPRRICGAICELLGRHLNLRAYRVYIGFEDVPARLWGWNGDTFG